MPFWKLEDETEPDILLRQASPNAFQLLQGFRYKVPEEDGAVYVVPPDDPERPAEEPGNSTDLASVPPWLWWFVASHGRHTRAALLHDHLVEDTSLPRREADRVFRLALDESGVRWLRRWLMWTAVSLATMAAESRLALFLFSAHAAALVGALLAWLSGWAAYGWVAALALGVAGFAWGRRWPGTILGVVIVGPATLVVWTTLGLTLAVDYVTAAVAWLRGRRFEAPTPIAHRKEEGTF
jgi:hypothetical protein